MKFLLDVNSSGALVAWLKRLDHDVAEVGQRDPRMSDEEVLKWAVNEGRVVITTDNDFEELIWRRGMKHCGVLRLENLPRLERKALLNDVLNRYGTELENGAIVIALNAKIRVRYPGRMFYD